MARENLENLEPLGGIRDKVNNNFTELYSATNTQIATEKNYTLQ